MPSAVLRLPVNRQQRTHQQLGKPQCRKVISIGLVEDVGINPAGKNDVAVKIRNRMMLMWRNARSDFVFCSRISAKEDTGGNTVPLPPKTRYAVRGSRRHSNRNTPIGTPNKYWTKNRRKLYGFPHLVEIFVKEDLRGNHRSQGHGRNKSRINPLNPAGIKIPERKEPFCISERMMPVMRNPEMTKKMSTPGILRAASGYSGGNNDGEHGNGPQSVNFRPVSDSLHQYRPVCPVILKMPSERAFGRHRFQ
ncbi:Uncharacterised protein [Neisseria gonorrhoeae]|uniref:Uncharacterized protein n=1 Tax=Neisseria gonorrhoeae TaxID=485 RepID=A0A379B185_NEIGO|nr:Uncharacterised protein [Neisseria gonorrhoeae]